MGNCGSLCCSEWTSPSLHVLLFIETLLFILFVIIMFALRPLYGGWLKLNGVDKIWEFFFGFGYLYGMTILITVYAPYQQVMCSKWYKITSLAWYGGYSLIVLIFWFMDDDTIRDIFDFPNLNINQYTIGYTSTGLIWPFLLPYLTGILYVPIGWQIVQAVIRGEWSQYATNDLLGGGIVLTLMFFIWYFVSKCKGIVSSTSEFPLISSKIMLMPDDDDEDADIDNDGDLDIDDVGERQWCCQEKLFKCWKGHCAWWFKCGLFNCSCCDNCDCNDRSSNDCDCCGCCGFGRDHDRLVKNAKRMEIELETRQGGGNGASGDNNDDIKNLEIKDHDAHLACALDVCKAYGGYRKSPKIKRNANNNNNSLAINMKFGNNNNNNNNELSITQSVATQSEASEAGRSNSVNNNNNNNNNSSSSKNNENVIKSMEDINTLKGDAQYKILKEAANLLFAKPLESMTKAKEAKYSRLAKDGKLHKPLNLDDDIDHLAQYDSRYLELNTKEPDTDDEDVDVDMRIEMKQQSASSQNDILTKYVTKKLSIMIAKQAKGKARGADRAFTIIGEPIGSDGIRINLSKKGFRKPNCDINKELLTEDALGRYNDGNITLIEAGCFVGDIADHFWPPSKYSSLIDENGKPYKVLPNRGGYKYLSLVGLSSVGAMGYSRYNINDGCNLGAIQSVILSLRLLAVQDGRVVAYQIEPSIASGGIHNAEAKQRLKSEGVELIQDDEKFSDVVTSMGTYGVITHAYIKLQDAFYIEVERKKYKINKWEEVFQEAARDDSLFMYKIFFNPYHVSKLSPASIVITTYKKSQGPPNTKAEIREFGGAEKGIIPFGLLALGAYAIQLAANAGFWQAVGVGLDLAQNEVLFKSPSNKLTMSCVDAVDLGNANGVPTIANGISFNVNNTINAVNGYIKFLNSQVKNGIFEPNLCITSPFSLRFAKKSFGSVSCAGEYDVGWIEQPIVTIGDGGVITDWSYKLAYRNGQQLLKKAQEYMFENFKAKVHWGLWFPLYKKMNKRINWWMNIGEAKKKSFFENYKFFNKDGLFRNIFTGRSGLDGSEIMESIEETYILDKMYDKAFDALDKIEILIKITSIMFLLICFPYFIYTYSFNACIMMGSIYPYYIDFFITQVECVALIVPLINVKLFEHKSGNSNYWLYHAVAATLCCIFQFISIFLHSIDLDEDSNSNGKYDKYIVFESLNGAVINEIEIDCDNTDYQYGLIYYVIMANLVAPIIMAIQAYYAIKLHMYLAQKKEFLCFNYKCIK